MNNFFANLLSFLNKHRYFVLFVLGVSGFLLWLNPSLWPVNDEYYYVVIGRAIHESILNGTIVLSDINSEHTPFIPLLVALFKFVLSIDTLLWYRSISMVFAIGSLVLLYNIFLSIKVKPAKAVAILGLLLLVYDFWIYAIRITLDMAVFFSFALLVYALLRKWSALKIGLILVFIFFIKEYYLYLAAAYIALFVFFDTIFFSKEAGWFKTIGQLVKKYFIIFLPVTLAVTIVLNFNFLTYPRLLENSLNDLFGSNFRTAQQYTVNALDPAIQYFNDPYADSRVSVIIPESSEEDISEELALLVEEDVVETDEGFDFRNIVTAAAIDSSIPESVDGPILRYVSFFSDVSLNPLLVLLFLIGIIVRVKEIIQRDVSKKEVRIDLVFASLAFIFLFFIFQQAGNNHSFRILLPLSISMMYFSYCGVRALWKKFSWFHAGVVLTALVMTLIIYWSNALATDFKSVLASTGIVQLLFAYKPYVYSLAFVFSAIVLVGYPIIVKRLKHGKRLVHLFFAIVLLGFFSVRFFPYQLNAQLSEDLYGYQYSLDLATPYLENVYSEGVITNLWFHKALFFSNSIEIPNQNSAPYSRTFYTIYPQVTYVLGNDFGDKQLVDFAKQRAPYVFLYREYNSEEYVHAMNSFVLDHNQYLRTVKEYKRSGELQWGLYKFDYVDYLQDRNLLDSLE